jgi:hypothetical protein
VFKVDLDNDEAVDALKINGRESCQVNCRWECESKAAEGVDEPVEEEAACVAL